MPLLREKKAHQRCFGAGNFLPLYRLQPRSIREILKHFKSVHESVYICDLAWVEYAIVNFSCVSCAKNRQALAQSALGI